MTLENARRKIRQARETGGALREALTRGHGCCLFNDPEFDQTLWAEAWAEQEQAATLRAEVERLRHEADS